jgi:hypothetical protein
MRSLIRNPNDSHSILFQDLFPQSSLECLHRRQITAMKTRNLLLCIALLPLFFLSSCTSGEYQLRPTPEDQKTDYGSWNYLPRNS